MNPPNHISTSLGEYFITSVLYLVGVLILILFMAISPKFGSRFDKRAGALAIAPIILYAMLEVNMKRQDWNFIMVNVILCLGAVVSLGFLFSDSLHRLTLLGLVMLNFVALILWWAIPSAHMKLF